MPWQGGRRYAYSYTLNVDLRDARRSLPNAPKVGATRPLSHCAVLAEQERRSSSRERTLAIHGLDDDDRRLHCGLGLRREREGAHDGAGRGGREPAHRGDHYRRRGLRCAQCVHDDGRRGDDAALHGLSYHSGHDHRRSLRAAGNDRRSSHPAGGVAL